MFWPDFADSFRRRPTLVTNIHLPNFAKGGIYQGAGKTVLRTWT